ncbi:MAG: hypothetical protein IIY70_02015, partial [Oscillospiraceae bacterium]|nr:hypothetical protein [Oscillospiraceae bacterium]
MGERLGLFLGADTMITVCFGISTDFSKIEPGEEVVFLQWFAELLGKAKDPAHDGISDGKMRFFPCKTSFSINLLSSGSGVRIPNESPPRRRSL